MIRNGDIPVHNDWYCDGAEMGVWYAEQLWRLDFQARGNYYQAQLFACIEPNQNWHDCPTTEERYVSFRLFIERDNRNDQGERIDYAYMPSWPLTTQRALQLLSSPTEEFIALAHEEIALVEALPNILG